MEIDPIIRPLAFCYGLSKGATKSLADAFHVKNLACSYQFSKIFGEAAQHSARVLVGPNTEYIGSLEFKQNRHLMEYVGDLVARKIGWALRPWFW